ncbi:DUF4377 domain-containing protein [Nocardia crassostreae]|uniref:DUF4377 domain-containing protein n=1 Tax=Nocardia crassostreae TaxID=53428 RepID=UPI000A059B78|nr:DUF4377 domain-containing protein [Nocardia crassostreae]
MRTRLRLAVPLALLTLIPVSACSSGDPAPSPATTAATTTIPGTRQFEIYVAPEEVPCTSMVPQTCLQVRRDPNSPWELHYDGIDGFDYQPGYTYRLLIEERPWVNPPADAPSSTWHLIKVISKEPAS